MKCRKKMRPANNGNDRGVCMRKAGHPGLCGNNTCSQCGVKLSKDNSSSTTVKSGSGHCRACERQGHMPLNIQIPGEPHTFRCGCSGILPKRGKKNRFAVCGNSTGAFAYRVSTILNASRRSPKFGKYVPIDPNTPHETIRAMMQEKKCVICRKPLKWEFGKGKTAPHLHHDHETGQIYGFAHAHCNPRDGAKEVFRLKKRVTELESEVKELRQRLESEVQLPKAA